MRNFLLVIFFFLSFQLFAADTLKLTAGRINIARYLEAFVDSSGAMPYERVREKQFTPLTSNTPTFGFTKGSPWLRFTAHNASDKEWFVRLEFTLLDTVTFIKEDDRQIVQQKHGLFVKETQYDMPLNHYLFNLRLKKGETATYYIEINGTYALQVPVTVSDYQSTIQFNHRADFLEGIYHGFMLMIILYNLFLFLMVKDRIYLLYVLLALSIDISLLLANGYGPDLLWNDSVIVNKAAYYTMLLAAIPAIYFSIAFLHIKKFAPGLLKWFHAFNVLYLLGAVGYIFGLHVYVNLLLEILYLPNIFLFMFTGFVVWKRGFTPAKYYLLAWAPLLLGVGIFVLKDLELVPSNYFTYYAVQAGSALEILLFSFALAERIRKYREEKRVARQKMIESMSENERLIREQNLMLEQKVKERTRQLEQKNKQITHSLYYASNLQKSILHDGQDLQQVLSESFVLHLPKDIVSGDFLWLNKNGAVIRVAVADCTGHGLPAAFLSVVTFNILQNLSKELPDANPAEYLERLKSAIAEIAKGKADFRDGLDIAFIELNLKTMKLQFAGARRPLYHLRGNQLTEIKGDFQSIEFSSGGRSRPFKNHSLQLHPQDNIYLFSDGYADQFGGSNGDKFYYEPFRNLLKRVSFLQMHQQREELEEAFYEWKDGYEQIDDVLVIGLRM